MKTLNYVVAFVLVLSFGFVSFGCGDSDSPTAPSPSTTMAEAPSYVPVNAARTMPASFDARTLQPGTGDDNDGFNAYDFHASYDGSMLTLTLIEDQMTAMREASKPHRNRRITVGICPSEPHHRLQACGDPIWQGSMRLAGRLELEPIPLASCEGWIVVNAAEMSDDIYDGWRNAPCPAAGSMTGSDGSGDEWPDYPEPERKNGNGNGNGNGAEPRVYTLPHTFTDPRGDSSGEGIDLLSVSMSLPDSEGWITVTYTTAEPVDVKMLEAEYPDRRIRVSFTADVESTPPYTELLGGYVTPGIIYFSRDDRWQAFSFIGSNERVVRTTQTLEPTDTFSYRFKYDPGTLDGIHHPGFGRPGDRAGVWFSTYFLSDGAVPGQDSMDHGGDYIDGSPYIVRIPAPD